MCCYLGIVLVELRCRQRPLQDELAVYDFVNQPTIPEWDNVVFPTWSVLNGDVLAVLRQHDALHTCVRCRNLLVQGIQESEVLRRQGNLLLCQRYLDNVAVVQAPWEVEGLELVACPQL